MNIVRDPKLIPASGPLSAEANQAAGLATATGILTVDLDAIVANWRKLEKTAVPAECAGVIKADAYGCGVGPVARARRRRLQDVFRRHAGRSARRPRGHTLGGDLCAQRLLPEFRRRVCRDRRQAGD